MTQFVINIFLRKETSSDIISKSMSHLVHLVRLSNEIGIFFLKLEELDDACDNASKLGSEGNSN